MPIAWAGLEQSWPSRSAVAVTLVAGVALAVVVGRLARRSQTKAAGRGVITDLHRFAVKGLGWDALTTCSLQVGGCFPADRLWALMRRDKLEDFDAEEPKWVHKMSFYAACSAGNLLARLRTAYDDPTTTLTVRDKQDGVVLLEARLDEAEGRRDAEHFFNRHLSQHPDVAEVCLVRAAEGKPHQFGNTTSGIEASGDVRTVHLVNRETVRALSDAAGEEIDPLRFRANILFDGLEPWEEFSWVGRRIAIGAEVQLHVVKRTVRCAATCVDLSTGAKACDVPALLQRHFPEHGPYLGVYAQVVRAGSIRCGDTVRPV
mmetsp:Transcript_38693/g.106584  ORF Transcript_38693/g.106584 Transcript_38693/m.106584 type:complete len:317 (-) Transcript_38693:265-1215(-)